MSVQVLLGKTVTFLKCPERRRAMDVPAGDCLKRKQKDRPGPEQGSCLLALSSQGRTRARGTVREDKKAGISAEDEKTKGHSTP